ncbi:Kininogen-1 [Galemys pyrenaicus]|uniref:Thiol proteinase inhibitor n=1 Tax=Galemys pyrenaicus TaxID=202257 RepID=A0A8J6AG58_GALPY|nr:Kininogen-1 [Galemys pyrenaicus]
MAVDAALKKYNDGNQSGNQFVLLRISSNVTKTDHEDPFYSFNYQIKEGDCPVRSGKTWQDCDYKQSEDAATGECTVTVEKKINRNFTVATQSCHITPGSGWVHWWGCPGGEPVISVNIASYFASPCHAAGSALHKCAGCKFPISTDNANVKEILKHAISHFNSNSTHTHLFALGKAKRAYKQVVAGWNFDITYSVLQTNCPKADFPSLTAECKILPNGGIAECTDSAYIDLSGKLASFKQQCDFLQENRFPIELCRGCPKDLPLNSSTLNEILNHVSTKLNANDGRKFYFKIDKVKKATVQSVAGWAYYIEFTAKETTCPKESNTEFTSSCEIKEPGQALICDANIYEVPWLNKTESTVNCDLKTLGSDLFAAVMPTPSPAPTGRDGDWIPNIQVAPNSFSFSLISDVPETPSPKCPGHPGRQLME